MIDPNKTYDKTHDLPVEGLNLLAKSIHEWAEAKGWNDNLNNTLGSIGTQLTNMHSELSEAWEEIRNNHAVDEVYTSGGDNKPEGFGIELADCIIRILHTCAHYGIDVEGAVYSKMLYNYTRPYRHGDKSA